MLTFILGYLTFAFTVVGIMWSIGLIQTIVYLFKLEPVPKPSEPMTGAEIDRRVNNLTEAEITEELRRLEAEFKGVSV